MGKHLPKNKWGFDQWAKGYDKTIAKAISADDWMYKDYDRILDKIGEYAKLPEDKILTVLDIGIGTGNLAVRFLKRGFQVIGLDPSKKMRGVCHQKYPTIEIYEGDFLTIPLPEKSVAVIVSSYAFHHLTPPEKERSISEMKRVLRPKGKIVIADLMFKNTQEERKFKELLKKERKSEIIKEIEDEYYGLFDDLREAFIKEGFRFRGEQLTDFVWIFCASLG